MRDNPHIFTFTEKSTIINTKENRILQRGRGHLMVHKLASKDILTFEEAVEYFYRERTIYDMFRTIQ